MAEAKKYLFDNFVVETRCVVEEPKDEFEEVVEEPAEEAFFDEPAAVEEKKYTKEELEAEVEKAETEGYKRGLGLAKEGIDADISGVLMDIDHKLQKIFSDEKIISERLEKQFLEISKSMIKTLLPNIAEENAVEIVNKFIADNFANLKKEAKLSFYIHPDIISLVQENIAKLANLNDYEGKISLHKDSGTMRSDCRIEWENGGVECNTQGLLDKMNHFIDETTGEKNNG